jgi:hypothetical protein
MRRNVMRALAELEEALVSEGVPEDEASQLVDGFEAAVGDCLDELSDEESEEADDGDDDMPETDGCEHRKDGYRTG